MLADTCLLPVPNPPSFAHALAAFAVARNLTNASIAGVSRNVTNRSPPISTALAFGPDLTAGNGTTLNPVFGFAFSVAITDGSVHLMLCALSAWYFAWPYVRR